MSAIKRMEQAIAVQPLSEKVTIPKPDAEAWVELARAIEEDCRGCDDSNCVHPPHVALRRLQED